MTLDSYDEYAQYEDQFDPLYTDRKARRTRRAGVTRHVPKKSDHDVITAIVEAEGLETGFETTYQPSLYERSWLLQAIEPFYQRMLITDVLAQIKGGKEACVYRCQAHAVTGRPLAAAKVYRRFCYHCHGPRGDNRIIVGRASTSHCPTCAAPTSRAWPTSRSSRP